MRTLNLKIFSFTIVTILLIVTIVGIKYKSEIQFEQLVNRTVVMYLNKSNVLVYGEKQYMSEDHEVMPYKDDDAVMMPVSFFAETISGRVTIEMNRAVLERRNHRVTVDVVNGPGNVEYAVLTELCEAFGLHMYLEENGIVAYSNQNLKECFDWGKNTHDMRDMIESFVYDDVTGEEIYELLVSKQEHAQHPRIMLTNDKVTTIQQEVASADGDEVYKKLYEQLLKEADSYLGKENSIYELRDGIRLLYVSQEALARIQSCSLAYLLTSEEKYAECAYAELEAVCNFANWNPRHFLDVGVMSMAVAFGYDWLYNWMTPVQREHIRLAVQKNAMVEVLDDINGQRGERTYQWLKEQNVNNWRCVCAGGLGTVMLSMIDEFEGDTLEDAKIILQKMMEALRPELLLWGPTGAYEEGHGYWQFAMSGYTPFIMSLEMNTGSNFGYVDLPGLNMTNEYLNAICGPVMAFNYHCAGEAETTIYPHMLYLANRLEKYEEAAPRIARIMGLESNADADVDILLYDSKMSEINNCSIADDAYFPVSEIASMRTGRDTEDVAVFLHCDKPYGVGGAGSEHMDAGTFSLQALGERWFFDLESDDYNISNLNQSYRFRAEGHNTVIFNPDEDYAMKKQGNCYVSNYYFSDKYSYAVGNMTDAYEKEEGINSFYRGVKLDKTTGIVTVQDEIQVKRPVELYWFAHTNASITISEDGKTATLLQGGSFLRVRIVNGEGATFIKMAAKPLSTSPVVPDQKTNDRIQKLTIHIEECGDIDLCVAFIASDKLSELDLDDYIFTKIKNW